MSRITNLMIIKHIKNGVDGDYGIYECDVDGKKKVFVRNEKEIGVVTFMAGRHVTECLLPVRDDVAKEVVEAVERKMGK